MMYNTSNPAELYVGTTWELLPADKYLKTGNTPLQQGGSNSFIISKANLPAVKLQIESFSLTRGTMNITGSFYGSDGPFPRTKYSGAFYSAGNGASLQNGGSSYSSGFNFDASKAWSGATSSASPYTTVMGSGTPLSINPEHITIKAWKRLS